MKEKLADAFMYARLYPHKSLQDYLSKHQPIKKDPRDEGLDDSWIHDVEMGAR
jgi:hypothetical protein